MSRKIYCLLLAFVLVLSVSCVAASDANQTAATLTQADETDGIQKVTYENTISNESTSETNGEQYTMDLKSNIDDYGTLTANVTVNESVKGNITFSINYTGNEIYNQTVAIENGSASFSGYATNASGTYIVTATYTGDANLTSKTINKILMITRNSPDLEIVSKIINDMGNIQVNITLNRNATGNITLAFNDTKKIIEIVNGTAILENYILEKGNYTMQAYYDGDRDYFKAVKNDTLKVEKSTTELRIDSLVSETGMMDIEAFVNENATGNITITITNANGTTIQTTQQTAINGTVILDPIFVENNTYTINATYTGDNNYYKATNSINIEITKKQAKLNITSVKVDDLGNISVNITIDENATGNITLAFNDNEVTIPIANGTATLENYRLAKGNYTITATYPENENYFKAIANETLDVKHTPELSINVESDEYGVQTVTLTIDENATGNITLYIIGNTSILDFEKAIENGTVIFNNITLEKDNYTFIAEYEGDDNYYKANATDTFNVTKSVPTLESIATVYDNVIVVNTNITNTTTGNVTYRFLLNGTEVRKVSIAINGTDASYIDTQIFQKGNYTVIIEYPGDENYYKANTTVNATIAKNTPEITINITTDEYGTTTISANSTAPGNITIDVFDSTSQVIISENNTYIGQFQKGNYTIIAIYPENDEYFTTAEQKTFEIAKSIANITANATVTDNIIVIKTEITNTTTGNVTYTFLINGTVIKQATVAINGTDASYTDKILQKGNYTILIEYAGDENYYKTNTTLNATIAKNTPEITIEITTDEYGTTTITAKANVTGNITLELLNTTVNNTYTGKIAKGNYTIVATSPEDEENFQSVKNATLIISKDIPAMNAILTMDENIVFIETAMYENATGNVTYAVYRNGTFIKEESVEIINGIAKFTDRLVKGQYDFFIEYQGDDNYFKANTTLNTSVDKVMPEINYSVEINGKNVIIYVNIENATGIVEYSSAIDKYNKTLSKGSTLFNGTYPAGNNTVTLKYYGDDANFKTTKEIAFFIKQSTTVKAGSVSVIYANTAKVTVTLTGENGPINNATVQITFNGKTYKAKTGSNGKVTISVSGSVLPKSYTCTVKFAGDNTSLASSGKFKITVKKATPKIVASKKTYKVSTKIKKYTVTLKNHKNKPIKKNKVSLKVNGKTYKVTTNTKGQAIFKITNLKKSAKFIALIKYTGNNYYNTVSKKVILTVKR